MITQKETNNMTAKYGAMTMLFVQDFFEFKEEFEVCQLIKVSIEELNALGCDIPMKLDVNNYEADYKQAFHKLGLSGDTAFKNNGWQVVECIAEISELIGMKSNLDLLS